MKTGRRTLLAALAFGLAGPAGAAAPLLPTPRQTRGPFYPRDLPLDSDNDLVRVAGRSGIARGEITDLRGRVLDGRGHGVAGARVEIWQCDAFGRYHHPWDRRSAPLDENFQGYGQFITASDGGYRFRTIKPVPYPGRAPHVHFAVTPPGQGPFITQMYVAGAKENPGDFLLSRVPDGPAREALVVDFLPAPDGSTELAARFDIVLPD